MVEIRSARIAVNGVMLHVAEAGRRGDPIVMLLHGFPECWVAWEGWFEPLVAAGCRVVAPDQRGYNVSDKPRGIAEYDLDLLADDIVALADHFGSRWFVVVGHDWGALVGWWIATRHPGRIAGLVALAAPHPSVWREAMRTDPAQRRLSRYVRFFQLPWLPELALRARQFRALAGALRARARPGDLTPAALRHYRRAWRMPGALTAMLNWYRALWRKQLPASASLRLATPVLLIRGGREAYGVPALAEASLGLCAHRREVLLKDATHWVQHDEPDRCLAEVLSFLRQDDVSVIQ